MTQKPSGQVIRPTDAQAIRMARTLVASARHGALAVLPNAASGFPNVSRVQLSTDFDGTPAILVSALSPHTGALIADARCSLLVGEVGKGDPLAHPRITLAARAARIERDTQAHARIRRRHLARHPKASLYADFGDFAFFRLDVVAGSLNGGFGKAYELTAEDLALAGDAAGIAEIEHGAIAHMNADHRDAIALYARVHGGRRDEGPWFIATMDSEGMDLVSGDAIVRVFYPAPLASAAELRKVLKQMADEARAVQGDPS
ncbi:MULTISPECIES: DUF2470 domain-containing protein [unclassified Roseitalea]|uniref:HugZ family pyridoxamine 5'-phosphate oxidase n=1 Tax=unclassified Roseitalea TaxID=2639107 RepID=UPI00273EDB54|nr:MULTISPECIES: DUF2470 domain-containing protein [unclassified Roseitalea]